MALQRLIKTLVAKIYFKRLVGSLEDRLRITLRKYPTWLLGHIQLAENLFEEKRFSECYVSLMAARQLDVANSSLNSKYILYLAKIYNSLGSNQQAKILLQDKIEGLMTSDKKEALLLLEEYIASLISLDKYDEAKKLIEKYKLKKDLSSGLRTVEEFLLSKN